MRDLSMEALRGGGPAKNTLQPTTSVGGEEDKSRNEEDKSRYAAPTPYDLKQDALSRRAKCGLHYADYDEVCCKCEDFKDVHTRHPKSRKELWEWHKAEGNPHARPGSLNFDIDAYAEFEPPLDSGETLRAFLFKVQRSVSSFRDFPQREIDEEFEVSWGSFEPSKRQYATLDEIDKAIQIVKDHVAKTGEAMHFKRWQKEAMKAGIRSHPWHDAFEYLTKTECLVLKIETGYYAHVDHIEDRRGKWVYPRG